MDRLSGIAHNIAVDTRIAHDPLQGSDVLAVAGYDGGNHNLLLQRLSFRVITSVDS
jgi:hypothetical protein